MKNLLSIIILIGSYTAHAQFDQDTVYIDDLSSVHLIFSSTIIKADIGHGQLLDEEGNEIELVAVQTDGLRLKFSAIYPEFPSTNVFVETELNYYSFILAFSPGAKPYVIPMDPKSAVTHKVSAKSSAKVVIQKEVEEISRDTEFKLRCEKIEHMKGSLIDGISTSTIGIWADGVYVDKDSEFMYITLNIHNRADVAYHWGYTAFFSRKKGNKSTRSEVVEEEEFKPIFEYNKDKIDIESDQFVRKVYVFPKFNIDKEKVLSIEIWEDKGERKTLLELRSKDILNAELIL